MKLYVKKLIPQPKLRKNKIFRLWVFWCLMVFYCYLNSSRSSERVVTFSKIGRYGRLGNQLFQIASTIGLAEKHKYIWKFPAEISQCSAGKLFGLHGNLQKGRKVIVYEEESPAYYDVRFPRTEFDQVLDLSGYFQSHHYFNSSRETLKRYLHFPQGSAKRVLEKYPEVDSPHTATIHVRRGDYLKFNDLYNLLDVEYYQEALSRLDPINTVLIVSDDVGWCKEFLGPQLPYDVEYSELSDEFDEFVLLLLSRKLVIANSTFSWWAAYLKQVFFGFPEGGHVTHVVAPDTWFNKTGALASLNRPDFCPSEWILVRN